jgi:hypothetical protein
MGAEEATWERKRQPESGRDKLRAEEESWERQRKAESDSGQSASVEKREDAVVSDIGSCKCL